MRIETTLKSEFIRAGFFGLLVFILLACGVEWFCYKYRATQATDHNSKELLYAENIRSRIEGELNAVFFLSDGLAAYWSSHPNLTNTSETRETLASFFRHSRHTRSFAVAPGYRIDSVYPEDDGGQSVGFDYQSQSQQWPLLRRSIESRSPVLQGPAPPAMDLAYTVPIYVGDQYWGLVSALINGSSLLSAAGLAQTDNEYQFALGGFGANETKARMIAGSESLFADPEAVAVDIAVPGGVWRLALKPQATPATGVWVYVFRILGWLFALLFAAQTTALEIMHKKLSGLALYDRLTGLPSKLLFLDRMKQVIRRAKRNRGNFSILRINLNDFKAVNKRNGGQVGDMVLTGTGKRLIEFVRHCDTVTRWEGDEFLILLDACPFSQAGVIAENLRHQIELPIYCGDMQLRVAASIGIATFPEDGQSLTALLKAADQRMLTDKSRKGS